VGKQYGVLFVVAIVGTLPNEPYVQPIGQQYCLLTTCWLLFCLRPSFLSVYTALPTFPDIVQSVGLPLERTAFGSREDVCS